MFKSYDDLKWHLREKHHIHFVDYSDIQLYKRKPNNPFRQSFASKEIGKAVKSPERAKSVQRIGRGGKKPTFKPLPKSAPSTRASKNDNAGQSHIVPVIDMEKFTVLIQNSIAKGISFTNCILPNLIE